MSNQAPKKLPTLRDSGSTEQLDVFQREIRKIFRGVNSTLEGLEERVVELEACCEEAGGGGGGAVDEVTAGSAAISVAPTTGTVVVDVVEANFSGIPQAAVTDLVADLTAITGDITTLQGDLTALEADVITEVIAGTNLSGGGSTGSVTLNVVDSPSFAGNVTCGNSTSADAVTVNGKLDLSSGHDTSALTATLTTTSMAATNASALRAAHTGSVDTTAGATNAAGLWSTISATRSAGANNLTNIAGFFSATGADVNEAIRTDAGNVNLNRTGGTTTIGGNCTCSANLTVNGNTRLGNANTDTVGFYTTAGSAQQTLVALTDSSGGTGNDTVQSLPNPADTPASADALRDDLVANLIPALRNNFADLARKVNQIRTVLVNLGLVV